MEGSVRLALEALDRGGADLKLLAILYIPHDALRPEVWPQREEIPYPLQDLLRYPSCRRRGWDTLRQSSNTMTFPDPLHRPRAGRV
jgi:hypothetical protein